MLTFDGWMTKKRALETFKKRDLMAEKARAVSCGGMGAMISWRNPISWRLPTRCGKGFGSNSPRAF